MMLPTAKTEPKFDILNLRLFLYGPPKIGKSTFCAGMPDAVFAATEPGLNNLSVFQAPIASWKDFLQFCGEIAAGKHPYKTVIIDTIDRLYRLCETHVCEGLNIMTPEDMDSGKGRAQVNAEFFRVMDRLTSLPYGLVFTSHAVTKEVKTPGGNTDRTIPTLPDKVSQYIISLADVIGFASIRPVMQPDGTTKRERVLCTKPHTDFDAGDRTGRLPESLPLSWAAFAAAMTPKTAPTPTAAANQSQASKSAPAGGVK
jgi:hypothetical protein